MTLKMNKGLIISIIYIAIEVCVDEVFENVQSCNSKDLEDFFRLKLDMETREEKYNDKKKENEKDVKKRYNKQYT